MKKGRLKKAGCLKSKGESLLLPFFVQKQTLENP